MTKSRWDQIRARKLADPAMRNLYDEQRRTFDVIRQIVEIVEQQRLQLGISKQELAQRAGANPAAIRRLLTSNQGNPTLQTLVALCDALGLELVIQRRSHDDADPPDAEKSFDSLLAERRVVAG